MEQRLNPAWISASERPFCVLGCSPTPSHHNFQDANSARLVSLCREGSPTVQHSSTHCAKVSSACRYSSVAVVTAIGAASPYFCQLRQPSIAHRRIPGHSALSFSERFV